MILENSDVHFIEEHEKGGIPALFIHGAGGSHAMWSGQFSAFRDCCRPIFVDLPGHGKSKGPARSSVEEYARWTEAFLLDRNAADAVLIGHSMGSAIALHCALHSRALRPKAIIVVGSGARLKVAPVIFELLRNDLEKGKRLIIKNLFGTKVDADFMRQVDEDMKTCGASGLLDDFTACDAFDVMNDVGQVTIPTLIVVGSMDVMTPVKYSSFLNGQISGSRLEKIEGAGHMAMIEKPDQFNTVIHRFLLDEILGGQKRSR